MDQIRRRRERREERRKIRAAEAPDGLADNDRAGSGSQPTTSLSVGDFVKVKGSTSVGKIVKLGAKEAVVQAGMIKLNVSIDSLERTDAPKTDEADAGVNFIGRTTREQMHEKRLNFKPDIDVRGMSGREAIEAITYFVEDAIQCGATRLSILHGTGTGYLRQVIRQYLRTVPAVASYHDEHIQFGGAGITIVEMDY
jgi:DNA mismatch repair protein MutS2